MQGARTDRRSGQIVIFVTLSMFLLFSVMGLAVDLGYAYHLKVSAQGAADAAATAAASYANTNGYTCTTNITCNSTYTCPNPVGAIGNGVSAAFQAGCAYAHSNGFDNGGSQTVTLIANNTTAPYASGVSTALWIQANVAQTAKHMFLFWAGFQNGSVATQATAGITVNANSSCIYVLDNGNTSGALTVSGAAVLTASSCGIYVNSTHNTALNVTGSARVVASQISVVGHASCTVAAVCNPVPTTGATAAADPLAALSPPSSSGPCAHTNYALTNSNVATISADGIYCGGISAIGASHLTLNAGTYVIRDGNFNAGNSAVIDANGAVTIYLTTTNSSGTLAGVTLGGASRVTLSAPTSGNYQGILFYQDRTNSGTTASSVGNSATLTATGTWYMPKGVLTLSGAVATGKMAVVVKDLTVANSATFQQDTGGTFTGLTLKSAALIQ